MSEEKTIEKLKTELEAVDTSAFDAMTNRVGATSESVGSLSPEQFASIYPAARAVLVALSAMWFMPQKIKAILDVLVKYLDSVTGTK